MMVRWVHVLLVLATVGVVAAIPGTGGHRPAGATFAGGNGRITLEKEDEEGNVEIFTMNADGGDLLRLTNEPAIDFGPIWSPDGSQIVFASERDDPNRDIYIMDADGSDERRLVDDPGQDFSATWTNDGQSIVWRHDGDLWVVAADGLSDPESLVTGPGTNTAPDFSPDGSRLAYASNADGDFEIVVADADGSNPVPLTDNPGSDSSPSWSPDGSSIVFSREADGTSEIIVMDADGDDQMNITNNPAYDSTPDWSPDGSLIAFYSDRSGGLGDIHLMAPDGSGVHAITSGSGYTPDWQVAPAIQGDTDCDLDVDEADVMNVLLASSALGTSDCIEHGDVDCDGDQRPPDALRIIRYAVALPSLPVQATCTPIGDQIA